LIQIDAIINPICKLKSPVDHLPALVRYIRKLQSLLRTVSANASLAKADTGKGVLAQIAEIVMLYLGDGHLAPDEYYQYCLYDDRRFSKRAKREFLGRWLEHGLRPYLNEEPWYAIAHDKLIAYALLEHFGFATPEIYALYHRSRAYGRVPALRTPAELAEHIRTSIRFPFVAKPVQGIWGKNVWAVDAIDRVSDRVRLINGRELPIDSFIIEACVGDDVDAVEGVLFQELLCAHPKIQAACGNRICSVRMVVIIDKHGPRLLSTLWKIATGSSMADNYWEPGNLVAPVDPDTGEVGRPFTGLGRDLRYVDAHPDTGALLAGFVLPDWSAAKEACLGAAANIPDIPMQAWDVALTSRGPVLLEVNVNGGMRLPQLTRQRGLYHGEFREFLARHGFPKGRSLADRLGLR
jgi:hypothetical protein